MFRFALLAGVILALTLSASAQDEKKDDKKIEKKEDKKDEKKDTKTTEKKDEKKDPLKGLEAFAGTWKVTKAEADGKPVDGPKLQFTFKDDKAEFVQDEKEKGTGAIAVNDAKMPAEIDMTSQKSVKSLGIYKFDSDGTKLFLCFVKGGDKRPTKFDSSELPGAVMLTLEKVAKK